MIIDTPSNYLSTTVLPLSDLHLEYNLSLRDFNTVIDSKVADIVILSGDIAGGTHALPFIQHLISLGYQVVYVLGNHEFYGYDVDELIEEWRNIAVNIPELHFLHNDSVVINDIEFIGSTLWTSMATLYPEQFLDPLFLSHISSSNDFNEIKNWSPNIMKDYFYESWDIVKSLIKNSKATKKVVVSHYLPSYQSIHEVYAESKQNPFYATELGYELCDLMLDYYFHGHTHDSCDYFIHKTNIICNPHGYKDLNRVNEHFSWNKIIKTI